MGKNRKWALETKAKGHPKYFVTCTKIEERGKTSWEKPPLKIQCNQTKRERKTVAKQQCPSLQDDHVERRTSAQWMSWWRCLQSVLLRDRTASQWPDHVLSLWCSAYGSLCASSAVAVLDPCKIWECSNCHTKWQWAGGTGFPTQWGSVVATEPEWWFWILLCTWPRLKREQ